MYSSCKICDSKHHAKGYCTRHYAKFKKYGDPLYGMSNMKLKNTICVRPGCSEPAHTKGYCRPHYHQQRRLYNITQEAQ